MERAPAPTQSTSERYRVYFNKHRYSDCSDSPRPSSRIIKAASAEDAENVMRDIRQAQWDGPALSSNESYQFIGMIFSAEVAQ